MGLVALLAWIVPALLLAAPEAPDPHAVEDRLQELRVLVAQKKAAGAWDEAADAIRVMSTLDSIHPKPYIEMVLLLRARGAIAEASAELDELGPPSGPGRVYGEGMLLFFAKKPLEARVAFAKALEGYSARGHLAGQAACHNGLGIVALDHDLDAAVAEYEAAREILARSGDRQGLSDVLHNLADVERRRGRPEEAVLRNQEALTIRKVIGTPQDQAQSWHALGAAQRDLADNEAALRSFEASRALRQTAGDTRGEVASTREMVAVLSALRHFDTAIALLRDLLGPRAGALDSKSKAELTRLLGDTQLVAGRPRDALEPLESAAAQFAELEDRRSESRALSVLGQTMAHLGEIQRGRTSFLRALEAARASGGGPPEAFALTGLGNIDLATGEMADALIHQEEALELYRAAKDGPGELSNLANLCGIYFALGHLARSRSVGEEALRKAEALGDETRVAQAYNNLGEVLLQEGQLESALTRFRDGARILRRLGDRRSAATVELNVAETSVRLGRPQEATPILAQAQAELRDLGDRRGEAAALNVLGELKRREGKLAEARTAYDGALRTAEEIDLPAEEWRAHAGLAAVSEAQGKTAEAARQSILALDRVERVRAGLAAGEYKTRFLAGKMDLYEAALGRVLPKDPARANAPSIATAFQVVERARARALLDLMAESRSQLRGRMPAGLRKNEEAARDAVTGAAVRLANARDAAERAAARRELELSSQARDTVEVEIRREAPGYGGMVYPRAVSLSEAQRSVLGDGEAILEYFVGDERAWLFVLERDRAAVHALPAPAEIAKRVNEFRELVTAGGADLTGRAADIDAAERLADAILPAGALPKARRLLVAPDGPLHHVAFDALRRGGKFLVETHEIVVVPSVTTLGLMRARPSPVAPRGWLGVGPPLAPGDAGGESPLPFSTQEIEFIASLFAEDERHTLLGADATKAKLLALPLERFRVVHFATHGWLDAESPRSSGLRLTPSQPDRPPDLLAVDDILGLPLAAELVVLSACRSGLGEPLRGEGLVGLTRSFLYAGSHQVVVTLWDVGDRTSADLMREFYRAIREGIPASEALRRAKLALLASDAPSRRRIRQWAPFVLVGNAGASNRAVARATD